VAPLVTAAGEEAFLHGLEVEVRAEITVAGATPALKLYAAPESDWLLDPAEVQSEQTGLRSLLGAVRALEAPLGPLGPLAGPSGPSGPDA
jgi:hypothetical protein